MFRRKCQKLKHRLRLGEIMISDLQKIKEEISKTLTFDEEVESELVHQASQKLERVLSDCLPEYDAGGFKKVVDKIKAYMDGGEVQRNKLLYFILDFVDPTAQPKTITANGEEIQQHAFLDEDELTKLYNFVKRHSADSTFDKTVYSVIAKHGMEPPQVYKNAMMRRQDFSRVTEVGNTSVTRRMAWQIIIGLHCNMDEADEVLFSAGYIRRRSAFDLTMEYFINQQNYDIMAINEVLYELGLKVFSCYKPVSDNQ